MFRSIVIVFLAAGLTTLCAAAASAGDAVLRQEYGSGVHAYFAGDYLAAHERLTAAIDGGSRDPRAYYFRGLVYLKLGRGPEAKMDFRQGAELEGKDLNRFYNVGKSLQRVQGEARLELERYRVEARMAALEEAERIRKARYEAIRREEERVLREQAVAAPQQPIEPAPPQAEDANPFAVPEEANPFAEPEKGSAAPPAGENPFDAGSAEPEKKPDDEAEKPKTKKPKGSLLDALGKALGKALGGGEKKPAEGKKDDKPAAGDKSAPDDPFADGPAKKEPAEKKPAEKKPAEKKPAEEKPAEKKPADEKKAEPDDPFAFAP